MKTVMFCFDFPLFLFVGYVLNASFFRIPELQIKKEEGMGV